MAYRLAFELTYLRQQLELRKQQASSAPSAAVAAPSATCVSAEEGAIVFSSHVVCRLVLTFPLHVGEGIPCHLLCQDPGSPEVAMTVVDSPCGSEKCVEIPLTQPSPPDLADSEEVAPSPVNKFLTRDEQNLARQRDSPAAKGRGRKRVKDMGDKEKEKKGKGNSNRRSQPAKRARGQKAKEEAETEDGVEPSTSARPKAKASAKAKAKAKSTPKGRACPKSKDSPGAKAKASSKRKAKHVSEGDGRVEGGEDASTSSPSLPSTSPAPAEAAAPLQTPSPKPRAAKPRKSSPAKHPLIDRDALKKEIVVFQHSTVVPYWSRPAVGLKVNKNRADEKPCQAWRFASGCCSLYGLSNDFFC